MKDIDKDIVINSIDVILSEIKMNCKELRKEEEENWQDAYLNSIINRAEDIISISRKALEQNKFE